MQEEGEPIIPFYFYCESFRLTILFYFRAADLENLDAAQIDVIERDGLNKLDSHREKDV